MNPLHPMAAATLALVLALACLHPGGAGQASLPPLPSLGIDAYPPAARDAIAPAARRAAAQPDDAASVGALARVLHAWEQYEAAHLAYARAQALAPGDFQWQYLDGLVLQRMARHAEAAARFDRASKADPRYLPARVAGAEALLDAGEIERSEASFRALAAEPLALPRAEFGLGRIEAARGRHAEALAHFERAVALFPEWGAAHYAMAQSLRAAGRVEDAGRALAQHARFGPRWPGLADPAQDAVAALRDDASASLRRGLAMAAAGDLEGAIAAHEQALAADPDAAQAHANLIGLYGRLRRFDRAEAHYRATVALGFNLADAHYDYGVLLAMQEKWAEAEAAYRQAIAVNPFHAEARNNLGQVLERRRAFEEAAAEYRQAVDARPGFRIARFNLGRMLLGLDRAQEAAAVLEPLQEPRDAETPRYLFALATAYVRSGRKDEARRRAAEARQLALDHGQAELAQAIERDLAGLR